MQKAPTYSFCSVRFTWTVWENLVHVPGSVREYGFQELWVHSPFAYRQPTHSHANTLLNNTFHIFAGSAYIIKFSNNEQNQPYI